jgi:pectate lyase
LLIFLIIIKPGHADGNDADSLVIQENSLGICTMDGVIETDAGGYTGDGYINADPGINTGVSWSFNVTEPGIYKALWRYALGGSDVTSRDGGLYINNTLVDTVFFPHSGSSLWSVWLTTDTIVFDLQAGINAIRLEAVTAKGLANLDYMVIYGSGLSPAECLPSFPLSVTANDSSRGSVSRSPEQLLYDMGTRITVTASPNPGYFFHSWSGVESDTSSIFTFTIMQKTDLTALFYEDGTVADPDANCYATVQHDNGTPYLLTALTLPIFLLVNSKYLILIFIWWMMLLFCR